MQESLFSSTHIFSSQPFYSDCWASPHCAFALDQWAPAKPLQPLDPSFSHPIPSPSQMAQVPWTWFHSPWFLLVVCAAGFLLPSVRSDKLYILFWFPVPTIVPCWQDITGWYFPYTQPGWAILLIAYGTELMEELISVLTENKVKESEH